MWVMSKHGFLSIVQKEEDKKAGMLTVRARVKSDLEALRQYLPKMGKIKASENSDYRYRTKVSKVEFSEALGKIAMSISYPNFKDEVSRTQGVARASVYTQVWSALRDLQLPSAAMKNS